ncbi:MAG: hypothetical protein AMJ61_05735 [Desulfobacterales bacterium SG8_35_2]|nr:MAG: hypothetical protein AMJ61_05735 [Desulfobacterales bacterium SG8_35_2]
MELTAGSSSHALLFTIIRSSIALSEIFYLQKIILKITAAPDDLRPLPPLQLSASVPYSGLQA